MNKLCRMPEEGLRTQHAEVEGSQVGHSYPSWRGTAPPSVLKPEPTQLFNISHDYQNLRISQLKHIWGWNINSWFIAKCKWCQHSFNSFYALIGENGLGNKKEDKRGLKVKSEVTQSCLTLCDPMDCSLPGSSDHGIFQTTVLEWVAICPQGEGLECSG